MDPTANLSEQRWIVSRLLDERRAPTAMDALRLAELVEALDNWIKSGGALPQQWQQVRP